MSEKHYLVSGSSRGIGLAISEALLAAGHRVTGIARSTPALHGRYEHIALDLSDAEAVRRALEPRLKQTCFDGLINNAGAGLFGSLEEFSWAQIEASLRLNLLSAMQLTRLLIPQLKRQARSDIVFIGSESALQGGRYGSVYSAAKFGLRGFAQSLRHECAGSNTHVGIVQPGMVRSDFFNDLHFGPGPDAAHALLPADVAAAVMQMLNAPDHALIEELIVNPRQHVVKKKPRQ
ncbi:SDR family oxidoreductase [Granulosicoccaceae sp. 1_MG-2023]|nr:SDR family oxidoreductase [Granulosicoccaceae sp. 1_MG-2023]